jgi:carboxypeptidase PM20D1
VKKIFAGLGLGFFILIAIMTTIMFMTKSRQPEVAFKGEAAKDTSATRRLGEILTFATVSYDDSPDNAAKIAALNQLYRWMEESYPNVFQQTTVESIGYSRLITLEGEDKQLKPALFLAHLDVVPASGAATGEWKYPPFSGHIENDTIYGRGVMDDKCIATALLEAMENQIKAGLKPKRSIMIALGHDEETGGQNGAAKIAAHLKKKGITSEFICDEGFGVMEGLIPGVKNPVAMIGIAEKGFLSVRLSVEIAGGHSSMPKPENATSVLVKALNAIENEKFKESICEPQKQFFKTIAPEASLLYRFLFSNLWITTPAIKMVLGANEKTAATIHTTHATTIIKAGDKDNLLPGHAEATVNFRILPGQTIQDVLEILKDCVYDPRIKFSILPDHNEASAGSSTKGFAWETINTAIHESFKDIVSAPAMVITGTDCKNYEGISDNIYRFTPIRFNDQNLGGVHGADEKLPVRNYYEILQYYRNLFGKL